MIKFKYVGLLVSTVVSTGAVWATPCASSGGMDTNVLPVRVPITAANVIGSIVSSETLNDLAWRSQD